MSDQDAKNKALIEIAKRSGEFKENYGPVWGGIIQLSLADKAVGRRPLLWGGLVSFGAAVGGMVLKYVVPLIAG